MGAFGEKSAPALPSPAPRPAPRPPPWPPPCGGGVCVPPCVRATDEKPITDTASAPVNTIASCGARDMRPSGIIAELRTIGLSAEALNRNVLRPEHVVLQRMH